MSLGANVSTANVDAASDDPKQARSDIETGFTRINSLLGHAGDVAEKTQTGTAALDLTSESAGTIRVANGGSSPTITGLGSLTERVGVKTLIFEAGIVLQHNASTFPLPGAANITTLAGDVAVAVSDGASGSPDFWEIIHYAPNVSQIATVAEIRAGAAANKIITVERWQDALAEVTLTDAATISVDGATFINAVVTLGGNRTMGEMSNRSAVVGRTGLIRVDNSGSHTLSWHSSYHFKDGTATTLEDDICLFAYKVQSSEVLVSYAGGGFA